MPIRKVEQDVNREGLLSQIIILTMISFMGLLLPQDHWAPVHEGGRSRNGEQGSDGYVYEGEIALLEITSQRLLNFISEYMECEGLGMVAGESSICVIDK